MTLVDSLAEFVVGRSFEDLSREAIEALRIRLVDSLGCAFGALDGEPIRMVRAHVEDLGGSPRCTLLGGGKTAPDRAALYNAALVRYLDFNDSYLAKGETCHPSDSLGAVLAATEYAGGTGRDLLTSLAVAYQVQCRLSDEAPVRKRGFDHTTQGSYAVAAGVSKALGLDARRTAAAIAISGTAYNALRVTRTGALSHWKGLAAPNTAASGTHAAFLAMRGITGPPEVFEGNKGFMDSIAGRFELDWRKEDLERVTRTILKKYNAEVHSQSAIEGLLELSAEQGFEAKDIERIDVDTFDVAFHIIGGGEEGSKVVVRTKEEADHSLPYMLAVALLDGTVMPAQYRPERIALADVQDLLRRIRVSPRQDLSDRFPAEMPVVLHVRLKDGRSVEAEKRDYEGFVTRPTTWDGASRKFHELAAPYVKEDLRREILDALRRVEKLEVADLMSLLGTVPRPKERKRP